MEFTRLKKGDLYIVRGGAVMWFTGEGEPARLRFLTHGNGSHWAAADDVLRPADRHDVDVDNKRGRSRGVACDDSTCWCRRTSC